MNLTDNFTKCNQEFFIISDDNKTVLDKNTGMTWEIKSYDNNDVNYGDDQYSHEEALTEYIDKLNKSCYGGFSDWRMPNLDELRSVFDYNTESMAINTRYFGNCQVGDYWAKNVFIPQNNMAWVIYSDFGSAIVKNRNLKKYVIAVRGENKHNFGESDNGRFVDNGNGTVTDRSTGLMWQKGENPRASLSTAEKLCSEMDLAGYDDWRLPNIKEINTIQNLSYEDGSWFFKKYFPAGGVSGMLHYRSSTIFKNCYSWVTNFSMGYDGYYAGFDAPLLFRAVRTAKPEDKKDPVFPLMHTGETKVYDTQDGKEIPVQKNGLSDAERITILPDYTVSKDNSYVCDKNSGLTWNASQAGEKFSYEQANDAIDQMNSSCFLGFRDWRLPLREELRSIMCYNGVIPSIYKNPFTDIIPGFIWTSQENKLDDKLAWAFYTGYGCAVNARKDEKAGIIAVRGRNGMNDFLMPSSERFIINGDETVTDSLTGYMWMQGETPLLSLRDALQFCKDCRLADYDDWVLPNLKEMASLINLTEGDKWFFTHVFPDTNIAPQGFYMTSTTFDASFGWGCNFQFGFDGYYADRTNGKYPFRPARKIK